MLISTTVQWSRGSVLDSCAGDRGTVLALASISIQTVLNFPLCGST